MNVGSACLEAALWQKPPCRGGLSSLLFGFDPTSEERMSRFRILTVAAVLLSASTAFGAATVPAPATTTAPSSGPAAAAAPAPIPADYSTPKAAARTFFVAMLAQSDAAKSGPALGSTLYIAPDRKDKIEPLLAVMASQGRLMKSVTSRFGRDGDRAFGMGDATAKLTARLKNVDDADVETKGDTAKLELPADTATKQSAGTMVLRKIDGDWKVDAAAMFQLDTVPAQNLEANLTLARQLTKVTQEMTAELNTGKYSSATEAYQDYWIRSNAARTPATMVPALPPSTAPASSAAVPASAPSPELRPR